MEHKQKLNLIGFLSITIICFLIGFALLRNNSNILRNGDVSFTVNSETADDFNDINRETGTTFQFRLLPKRLIRREYDYFPNSRIVYDEFPEAWTVKNFLDHYYSGWQNHYSITENTGKKAIKMINNVFLKPKPWIVLRKLRINFTKRDLDKLNLIPGVLLVTETRIDNFLRMINDSGVSWNKIQNFIHQNFVSSKTSGIIQKIKNSVIF